MKTESEVQQLIRAECSKHQIVTFRNNVGAGTLSNGSFIRWGLANESVQQNHLYKSADLIGIKPIIITADMIGQTIGQFVSIECKKEGWLFKEKNVDITAQQNWLRMVQDHGGLAIFSTGELSEILK